MLLVTKMDCAQAPDLRIAVPLPFDGKNDASVAAKFDANSPCLEEASGKSLYRLYRLPDFVAPYIISVASTPADGHLLAFRSTLLNESGAVVREVPLDTETFREGDLSLLFRGRKGEAYLLISSDPERAGRNTRRIQENVQATSIGFGTVYSGTDTTSDLVYSHDGSISVTLSRIPAGH